ncbi:unnamed protein product [Mytilus edulis]|uniref:C2H2-type domain-containing protein n=1 Tax=Mytilus edulis TaxID=6550 RepID=A0A8S3RBR5_MYTED|nr:unnamed protein product [Mytilus edulis]
MSDYICNWDDCEFEGQMNFAIRHIILTHAPPDKVPFFCKLCQFRTTNLTDFERHIATFRSNHLLETENVKHQDHIQTAGECYNVTWGNQPTTVPVLLEVNEDYIVYNEVVVQTTATQTDDKYEDHGNLKKQHNKEMNNLADYIVRLERKLSTKDQEIMQL